MEGEMRKIVVAAGEEFRPRFEKWLANTNYAKEAEYYMSQFDDLLFQVQTNLAAGMPSDLLGKLGIVIHDVEIQEEFVIMWQEFQEEVNFGWLEINQQYIPEFIREMERFQAEVEALRIEYPEDDVAIDQMTDRIGEMQAEFASRMEGASHDFYFTYNGAWDRVRTTAAVHGVSVEPGTWERI
jgi:hypothetical protein